MNAATIFKKMRRPLCGLRDRWQTEEKGAAFKPYREEVKAYLKGIAPNATFVNVKRKPFALTFNLGEHTYKLTATESRYSIKRLP
jgi:hypothetical protein